MGSCGPKGVRPTFGALGCHKVRGPIECRQRYCSHQLREKVKKKSFCCQNKILVAYSSPVMEICISQWFAASSAYLGVRSLPSFSSTWVFQLYSQFGLKKCSQILISSEKNRQAPKLQAPQNPILPLRLGRSFTISLFFRDIQVIIND